MFRGFTGNLKPNKKRFISLALQPAKQGHGRTLCLISDCSEGQSTQKLASFLKRDGWKVVVLDLASPGLPDTTLDGVRYQRLAGQYQETNWYIQMQSLLTYHWLRDQTFDVIIFHRTFAAGYYSCMARHLGLTFAHAPIAIFAAETHAGMLERTLQLPSGRHDFEIDFMERKTVELADGFCTMSNTTGQWMREAGWAWPSSSACISGKAKANKTGAWISGLISQAKAKNSRPKKQKPVFISVCIATYNRPKWLRGALASLEQQTNSYFEVIVVDDGSSDPAVKILRQKLKPLFRARNWHWIKTEECYGPAAARNHAAEIARGDYFLFMDDDDICYPDELERFALAAQRGGAIIDCILGMHPESENTFPPTAQLPERNGKALRPVGWTPIGGDLALTAFINVGGYAHALYNRQVFKRVGRLFNGTRCCIRGFLWSF